MTLTEAVERAVFNCYDATWANHQWTSALDSLARALAAEGCVLLPHDPADRPFDILHSTYMEKWKERWHQNRDWAYDVYAPRGTPLVRDGTRVLVQSQLFSQEEIKRSAFHQEIAGPAGCIHWAASCFTVDETAWCLPVFRRSEPFSRREANLLAEVSPHLSRIVSLAKRTATDRAAAEVMAFDRLGCPAMLIDSRGRIERANSAAEALACSDFYLSNGRLRTTDRHFAERIENVLSAVRTGSRGAQMNTPPLLVFRDRTPWLLVEAVPVTGVSSDYFGVGVAILIITDLKSTQVTNAALLKLIFGLTSAEARLASALCSGTELYSAAKQFGVSRETVRCQLRAIFGKVGVRRQTELIVRLHNMRRGAIH
jgi:DNA-binding CsgD family transcriptional regulator